MEQEIIGVDIDGIILDFERVIRTYAEMYDLLWLKKDGKKNNEFFYMKQYDWTDEEKQAFKDFYLPYATRKSPLVAGAIEALTILKSLGYKIVLITARGAMNPEIIEIVNEVLDLFGVPYDDIFFKQFDKVKVAKELGIKYMIDDSPHIVSSLADEGISSLYFRDKYAPIIEHNLITEVSNWGEILRILMKDNLDIDVVKKVFPSPFDFK